MTDTAIEWCDRVWNPVTGCTKVSPGCKHCYAEGVADRFWSTQYAPVIVPTIEGETARPRRFTDVQTHADRLDQPLRWKKPARIFVNSMSDLFHEDVPDEFIDQVFAVMALSSRHAYQVLTKRADRMHSYMNSTGLAQRVACAMCYTPGWDRVPAIDDFGYVMWRVDSSDRTVPAGISRWPLPNVWLGVSVENQEQADKRIPLLLQTPAAVRFLSCEPLLEGLDLAKHRPGALGLGWVIVGGESGRGARPCQAWWVRNIVGQCHDAGIPVFVKQLGAHVIDRNDAGYEGDTPRSWPMDTDTRSADSGREWQGDPVIVNLRSAKGGDMAEWPTDLRVREFPQ